MTNKTDRLSDREEQRAEDAAYKRRPKPRRVLRFPKPVKKK